MAMKCCLEHGEIERQWKCKICMWRGTVLSWVLEGALHKGEIKLHDAEVEACIRVEQVTTEKCTHIEFYCIWK
jgi:hypothetical protein